MDDIFTINNPGYWLRPSKWPHWSTEDEHSRLSWNDEPFVAGGPRISWDPGYVFLLQAVHRIGKKKWGDQWRTPPFRPDAPDDAAALDRFMRTVVRVRALCAGGVLPAYYEVLHSDGPDGRYDPDMDDLRGIMHSIPYDHWYAPGWERFFLLGVVRTDWENWIYVVRDKLDQYVANLKPQQDEPAAPPAQVIEPLSGPGRPPEYDWEDGIAFAEKQLDQRGDPKQPENQMDGWRSDTDVGRAVAGYLAGHNGGKEPDLKNTMKRVAPAIKEWRRKTQN